MIVDQKFIPRYKVILIGNTTVGKTTMVESFTGNFVSKQHFPTVGTGFYPAELNINGIETIFDIWDTAGQEMYRALVPQYIRGAAGAIVVFDITSKDTFLDLENWLSLLKPYSDSMIPFLFGNKLDNENERQVSYQEAHLYAEQHGMIYREGSALTGDHIKPTFHDFFSEIVKKINPQVRAIRPAIETSERSCCS